MRIRTAVVSLIGILLVVSAADAQTCRQQSVVASGSALTLTTGYEKSPTAVSNADAVDGSYYQITNALGLGPNAVVRSLYDNWVQTNASNTICTNCDPTGTHPAIYGASFVNPTNQSITITQVDFTTNVDNFTPTTISAITPATGWQPVSQTNRRLVRWTGSIVVASRSAQDFIFGDSPQNNATNNTTRSVNVSATLTTSAGSFSATPFTMTALTSTNNQASNASVSFDATGAANPVPIIYFPGKSSGVVTLPIRVGESGSNGTASSIAAGLQLTITIPARWSSVSVPTVSAPWTRTGLSITQPTATTNGQVVISTNAIINAGTSTAANTLVIQATAPSSSVSNLFPFRLSLNGLSRGGRSITSFNDSVVQIVGSGTEALNENFLSSALTGPIRQIDFTATVNVADGLGSEAVNVDVFNNTTSSWETMGTVTGSTNVAVTRTFGSDFLPYVSSNQMRVRLVSNGNTVRTIRLDQVKWLVTRGYTVNNAAGVGSDANVGDVARPFQTVGHAAAVIGPTDAVYVEVGASQTGTPYDSNLSISAAGTSTCSTSIFGVAGGGLMPRVRGIDPASDWGFDVAANYVQVSGFRIENTNAALVSEAPSSNIVFSGNDLALVDNGYGIVLNNYSTTVPASTGLKALNNTINGSGTQSFIGIYDAGAQGSVIDGNKLISVAVPGIAAMYLTGASPVIQRNIVTGNSIGVYLARTTGAVLYNNTIDSNSYRGIHCESSTGITARNNIISRNAIGFSTDTANSVDSDYADFWGNTTATSGFVDGAHSIAPADPQFVQTSSPSLATYFQLQPGSTCIDAGLNVGLPFLGLRPDLGAVESQ